MTLEEANELRDSIQPKLKGLKSYCKVVPKSNNEFRVVIIQNDQELPDLPTSLAIIPGERFKDELKPYAKPPVSTGKDLDRPMSPANRTVEPSDEFRWRSREIQDIVKRVAMENISKIANSIELLALGRDERVDNLLESLQKELFLHGIKETHPTVKLLIKLQRSYNSDTGEALVEALRKKYPESSPQVTKAKHINEMIRTLKDISPEEVAHEELAKEAMEYLKTVETHCAKLVSKLRKLKLDEEANQLRAMAASAKDVYKTVKSEIG